MKFCDYTTDELIADYGEATLVGISFKSTYDTQIIAYSALVRQMNRDFFGRELLIQTASVKNLTKFLTTLDGEYNCRVKDAGLMYTEAPTPSGENFVEIAEKAVAFEETMEKMETIFLIMGGVLLVVLVLMVINLVSFSITQRKREIGVLSALGASNKDMTSIFLLETAIISVISFVFVFVSSFVFVEISNRTFSKKEFFCNVFPFLRVNVLTVAIAFGLCFGLMLLAALIPLRKIISLKPIEAIRGN